MIQESATPISSKNLSHHDLLYRFGKLVRTERKITHLVLECIAEIDRRKLYLEKAYPSLFEFLVKEYGYSPSAAMRRIDSARLLRQMPELSEKIENGAVNLSQLSKVQQAVRTVQKLDARQIHVEEKRALLAKIENTSQAETETILAKELDLPVHHEEKARSHRDESVTLTITFSREQMDILEKARALCSHALKDGNWNEVVTHLATREVKTRMGVSATKSQVAVKESKPMITATESGASRENERNQKINTLKKQDANLSTSHQQKSGRELKPTKTRSADHRYIPLPVRKALLNATCGCQYTDKTTGKKCASTKFLQIDHIQPVWAGGNNDASNLQVLCAQHNRYKYKTEAGLLPLR